MSLHIKNPETHRLAQELAELTGESMATAVAEAVRERLARQRRKGLARKLMEIGHDCSARMSTKTKRTDHGELLHDERGLPK